MKKRAILIPILLLGVLLLAFFAGAEETSDVLYVSSADELHSAMTANSGGTIHITEDLDLGVWDTVSEFSGVLDGQGHTLRIGGFNGQENSLWGSSWEECALVLTNRGTIRNIRFVVEIDGKSIYSGEISASVIANSNAGLIEQCSTEGSFAFQGTEVGYRVSGFVDSNNASGIIRNCYSTVSVSQEWVSGSQQSGQMFGFLCSNEGTMENCYSTATAGFTKKTSADFCASNNGTMRGCYYTERYDLDSGLDENSCSLEELLLRRTYEGWDFGNVWCINTNHEQVNGGLPVLRSHLCWEGQLDEPPQIQNLELDETEVTIGTREFCPLTATMTPAPADVLDPSLEWVSSDETVAKVSPEGVVEGTGAGSAEITVRSNANPEVLASCTINVELSPEAVSIEDLTLERGASGTPELNIYPDGADGKMRWSIEDVENKGIAAIDPDTGEITALERDGTVLVTVTAVRGGRTDTAKLTVRSPVKALHLLDAADGTELNNGKLTFYRWEERPVSVRFTPESPTVQEVKWLSSKPEVVSVREGTLYANAPGTARITVIGDDGAIDAFFDVQILMRGDLNGDGLADGEDAQLALDADSGLITLTDAQLEQGDVTGDGRVNVEDALKILRYASGGLDSLPPGGEDG